MFLSQPETETMNIAEAAAFLGFKSKNNGRFAKKVKAGLIPGCKLGREWRFIKSDLIACMRKNYVTEEDAIAGDSNTWQLAKKRAALTTIQGSHSAASECKNRLDALQKARRKNLKTSDGRK